MTISATIKSVQDIMRQDGDMSSFDEMDALRVQPLSEMGRPMEIFGFFGGVEKYQATVRELRDELYAEVA